MSYLPSPRVRFIIHSSRKTFQHRKTNKPSMTELQIKSYHSTFSQAFAKPPARIGIKHATWQLMPNHFIIHRSEILLLPENHKVHKNSLGGCQPDLPTWLPAKLLCHAQQMGQTHSPHHSKLSVCSSGNRVVSVQTSPKAPETDLHGVCQYGGLLAWYSYISLGK